MTPQLSALQILEGARFYQHYAIKSSASRRALFKTMLGGFKPALGAVLDNSDLAGAEAKAVSSPLGAALKTYADNSKTTAQALVNPGTTQLSRREFLPVAGRAGFWGYAALPSWAKHLASGVGGLAKPALKTTGVLAQKLVGF